MPVILVPSPNVAENHQYHNAMALVNQGAGIVIEQKDLTAEKLGEVLDDLTAHPVKYALMGQKAREMARTDAKKRIADIVLSLCG